MNWLGRLFHSTPKLDAEHAAALNAYRQLPPVVNSTPLSTVRFIVADVETTGLNPFRDRLISIGAITVTDRTVRLGSSFEVVFRQPRASSGSNILIHGIDGTTQLSGLEPATAMLRFLGYAGKAPLVGFHSDFDRVVINRASKKALGPEPSNIWLDLAFLAPALLTKSGSTPPQGLDGWADKFGIHNHARHNAVADAWATAQLLQIVLTRAMAGGATVLGDLVRIEQDQRWLEQQKR